MTDAWEAAHARVPADASPGDVARMRNARRRACDVIAGVRLSPIVVRMTEYQDYDKLRINVFALVAPGLVQWR